MRKVYLYPDTSATQDAFAALAPRLHIPLRSGAPGQGQMTGHQIDLGGGIAARARAYATWSSVLPVGEEIRAVLVPPPGPVASLGKVLGNRTTLYKYLNPRAFAVLSAGPHSCGVYVLDGAKGNIIYRAEVPAADGCDVQAEFVENWLVYVYWDMRAPAKGQRVVSVELYEGHGVDDKRRRCVCTTICLRCATED